MRNLYLLFASAVTATAICAYAQGTPAELRSPQLAGKAIAKNHENNVFTPSKTIGDTGRTVVTKSMRKADGQPGIYGLWIFQLGDYYFGQESVGSFFSNYEANPYNDFVLFEDPEGNLPSFYGTFDAETNVMTFEDHYMGQVESYYQFQKPFVFNYDFGDMDYEPITADFDSISGSLTFAPETGIAWAAYKNMAGTQPTGEYYYIFDFEGALDLSYEADIDNENWEDLGEVYFMDGWVLPGFEIDQQLAENLYMVPMQQNKKNSNVYRLVDPYQYGPAAGFNEATRHGYIEFDISDPDHVVFNRVEAGYTNTSQFILTFYCYNSLGSLCEIGSQLGVTIEDIIESNGNKIPYTTYKDGIVSLTSIKTGNNIDYDANFGYQSDPYGGYYWSYQNNARANMDAAIWFPGIMPAGIDGISADNNLPTLYYNLQGQRVTNPQAGQILIKRTGSKVSKLVVR